jgi:hypothetical protein
MYASNGDREGDIELQPMEYERQRAALASDGAAGFVVLYCRSCQQVYCYRHWFMEYVGEGSPRSFGTCPKGHGRVIDGG